MKMPALASAWPKLVFLAMEWQWMILGAACLGLSLALALKANSLSLFERQARAHEKRVSVAVAWLTAWIVLFKLAQFVRFQLLLDSGVTANLVWNLAHGYGWISSLIGDKPFIAVHFAYAAGLLAPLLWLHESTGTLAAAQGAATGAALWGVFLLARRILREPAAAVAITALCASQLFFHGLIGSVVHSTALEAPLFIWMIYCRLANRRVLAIILALALLSACEDVPFVFFGLGACVFFSCEGRDKLKGLALAGAAVLIFAGEMTLIHRAQRGWAMAADFWHWQLYGNLGSDPGALARIALTRPWKIAALLAAPAAKLWTPVWALGFFSFLPLLAGPVLLPFAAVWLPHQLAGLGSGYHEFNAHNAALGYATLCWAAIVGFRRALELVPAAKRRGASGALFMRYSDFYLSPLLFPSKWATAAPRALARIRPGAKVWCDEFLLPQLALMRHVRTLPGQLPDASFTPDLFLPDQVLLSTNWFRFATPDAGRRITGFLQRRGFQPVFREADLILLERPGGRDEDPPRLVSIPAD